MSVDGLLTVLADNELMRWVVLIVAVIGVYVVDATFSNGQLSRQTTQLVRDLGYQINQEVADLMRPLRR